MQRMISSSSDRCLGPSVAAFHTVGCMGLPDQPVIGSQTPADPGVFHVSCATPWSSPVSEDVWGPREAAGWGEEALPFS